MAKGKLVTTDSTRSIGGTVLGKEFVGVYVETLENNGNGNNGDEMLPRPLFSIKTMKDAIGFLVAWPRSHVSSLLYYRFFYFVFLKNILHIPLNTCLIVG